MTSARACFAGASSGSLNRWPIHSNLLFWIFLLHSTVFVLEYRSLFDIFFGHAIFKIFLSSDLWKMLMSSVSFFVRVQSSALFKKMLSMYALKILILFLMVNLLLKAIFNLLKARMAKHFLLEISLLVSSSVPRYLHFSSYRFLHVWFYVLLFLFHWHEDWKIPVGLECVSWRLQFYDPH